MSLPPVAIVTGAGSGIGAAVCLLLSMRGWRLTLVGRTETRLEATVDRIAADVADPGEVLIVPADVSDADQAAGVVAMTLERWGRVDALVNNAGHLTAAAMDETTEDLLFTTFAINTFGPAYLIRAVWPVFVREKGGCVVNVSSIATVTPFPGLGVYGASKCAIEGLTTAIEVEGAEHGIRAFSVAPGATETAMLRSIASPDQLPEDATLDPVEVAEVIVACIAGERDEERGRTILLPSPGG